MARSRRISLAEYERLSFNDKQKLDVGQLMSVGIQMDLKIARQAKTWQNHQDLYSPAFEAFKKRGTDINWSTFKDKNQLLSELNRGTSILNDRTFTIKGAKEYRSDVIQQLKKKGVKISNRQYNDFFRAYEQAKELDPTIANMQFKYGNMDFIASQIAENKTPEEIAISLRENLNKIYEAQQEAEASQFYDLDDDEELDY